MNIKCKFLIKASQFWQYLLLKQSYGFPIFTSQLHKTSVVVAYIVISNKEIHWLKSILTNSIDSLRSWTRAKQAQTLVVMHHLLKHNSTDIQLLLTSNWSVCLGHELGFFISSPNASKQSIAQENKSQIDLTGFNLSILKTVFFFPATNKEKVKQFRKFCPYFILAWAEHNAKQVFGLQNVRSQGMNPFQAATTGGKFPLAASGRLKRIIASWLAVQFFMDLWFTGCLYYLYQLA